MIPYYVRDSIFAHYTCAKTRKVFFADGVHTAVCESQSEHRERTGRQG